MYPCEGFGQGGTQAVYKYVMPITRFKWLSFHHVKEPPPSILTSLSWNSSLKDTFPLSIATTLSSSSSSTPSPPYLLSSLSLSLNHLSSSRLFGQEKMVPWSSLRQMFDQPMPDRPTLMESLSWNQIKHVEPTTTSFEMFGEIQFREKSPSFDKSPLPSPLPTALSFMLNDKSLQSYAKELGGKEGGDGTMAKNPRNGDPNSNDGFSPKNSETLQLRTERLGFESLDDVEDLTVESSKHLNNQRKERADYGQNGYMRTCSHVRSGSKEKFPPPITTIGRGGGRPWIYFKSYRKDGRFVLKESRIPMQQCLQATRENGRLVLQLVHPDEGIGQENDEESDEEEKDTGEVI